MSKYYDIYDRVYGKEALKTETSPQSSLYSLFEIFIERFGDNNKQYKILEMGCGTGQLAQQLEQNGHTVLGVDVSQKAVELAKKNESEKCQFVCGDATTHSFEQQFDIAIDGHCLHCIVTEEDRHKYLQNIIRSLKPNGYFILESMLYHKQIKFNEMFYFDQDYSLWKHEEDFDCDEIRTIYNKNFIPYRKILPSIELENELLNSGLAIKYLYCHNNLRIHIEGNAESNNMLWDPSIIRVILKKEAN